MRGSLGIATALVVLCLALNEAARADLPAALVIEQRVAEAIAAAGSTDSVAANGGSEHGGAAANALAGAIVANARGRAEEARQSVLAGFSDPAADPDVRGALVGLAVALGIPPPADDARLAGLARAALDARAGGCDRALEATGKALASGTPSAAEALLAALTRRTCGRPGLALAALAAAPTDPRVSVAAGSLLLALGDDDGASAACREAAAAAPKVPTVRYAAAVCLATADARRGLLPSARRSLLEARLAGLRDPALPREVRIRAGQGAAWLLLVPADPVQAREALAALAQVESLVVTAADRDAVAALRIAALAGAGDLPEAGRLAQLPAASGDPLASAVRTWAGGRLAKRLGAGTNEAIASLGAIERARAAGARALATTIAFERLTGSLDDLPESIVATVVQLLAEWPADAEEIYLDPALPRRAVQYALEAMASRAPDIGVIVAERLRHALRGDPPQSDEVIEPDQYRLYLAARDASCAVFIVGETRSFGWLLQTGETSAITLPSGDELAANLPAEPRPSSTSSPLDPLLAGLVRGADLLVVPDGFLGNVSWGSIPVPRTIVSTGGLLASIAQPAILPSLRSLTEVRGARVEELHSSARLIVVTAGERQGTPDGPSRFERTFVAPAELTAARGLFSDRGVQSILHIDLPLLAAGARPENVLFAVPGGVASVVDLVPAVGVDLVTLAPPAGWTSLAASRVRAGAAAVERGARAALVATAAGPVLPAVFGRFYDGLARGDIKSVALSVALELEEQPRDALALVGHARTRVVDPERKEWPFWTALGAGFVVIAVVLVKALWRSRDPFEAEPPEESEVMT